MVLINIAQILSSEFKDYINHHYYGFKLLVSVKDPLSYENKDLKELVTKLRQYIKLIPDLSTLKTEEICLELLKPLLQTDHYYLNKYTGNLYADVVNLTYEQRHEFLEKTGYILKKQVKPISKTKQHLSKIYIDNLASITKFKKGIGETLNKQILNNPVVEYVLFSALGGASEIGRSCYLLKTNNSTIMIDCGYKISKPYEYPLLNFKDFNLNQLTAVIITHAHGDHCGVLPALYSLGYTGPVYMTEATQSLTAILNLDSFKIQNNQIDSMIYSMADVKTWILKTILLPIRKTIKLTSDITLTCFNSNHLIGGVMIKFRINNKSIFFTSDFRYKSGFSLLKNIPNFDLIKSQILIAEGTNLGKIQNSESYDGFKNRILAVINDVITNTSFVLFPVIAAGRGEEVLYTLDEVITENNLNVTVFLEQSTLQTFYLHLDHPQYLKPDTYTKLKNILLKPYLKIITNRAQIYDQSGVIVSPSGMLEGGPSVEHFIKLCESKQNHVFFTCYQGFNSLGRQICQSDNYVFFTFKGTPLSLKLNLQIHTSNALSGHTSHTNTIKFIKEQNSKTNILIHCNLNQVLKVINTINLNLIIPQNLETTRL